MKLNQMMLRSRAVATLLVLATMASRSAAQNATPTPTPASATPTPASVIGATTQAAVEPQATDAKRAGQDVPVPTRKKYVAPEYPGEAALQGIRGIVILELLISETGAVSSARVSRSIPGLDEAAIAAVKLWEYEPSKLAGKPVKVLMSQSITFSLKLPEIQRSVGIPELKSGGAPSVPASLTTAESAALSITLGAQGEVRDLAPVEGNAILNEALIRAVKSWRFNVISAGTPPTFTIRAEWSPGPPPALTLRALDLKPASTAAASAPTPTTMTTATSTALPTGTPTATAPQDSKVATDVIPAATPVPAPTVATEVLPAREAPPAKEEGTSTISDVALGPNIPDLVRGRRPTWPPLARLGNITGEVVVRFSVDLAGKVTVHSAEGPDMLKDSAEQAVGTWLFRRTAIDRIHLVATFKFGGDRSTAKVERQP